MVIKITEKFEYIDKENDIIDFGTGNVSGKDIFDNRTHVPFYDDIFTDPQHMKTKYNLVGEIKMMSPNQYYVDCAKYIFPNSTKSSLIASRRASERSLQEIRDIIFKYGKRVFLPYINYAEKKQEGLHRMMVAGDEFGWDTKFPVLVINWYDENRAKEDVDKKEKEKYERAIGQALSKSNRYSYKDFDEFKSEMIDYLLDAQLRYFDGYPFDIDIYMVDDGMAVIDIKNVIKYKFNPNYIEYKNEDDTDLDDIEINEDDLDDSFINDIDFNI